MIHAMGVGRMRATLSTTLALTLLSGSRRDPEFMTFDAEARRVDVTVIAAFDKSNSGYNFNGAPHGTHLLTVPAGWRVRIRFSNRDVVPHSVGVIRQPKTLPLRVATPVFRGAASRSFPQGLPPAAADDLEFVASPAGDYLIGCGSTGHLVLGVYLRLRVSPDIDVPTYERVSRLPTLRHD